MKNTDIIKNLENRLNNAKTKQMEAFRRGNFNAVNRWTKIIVSTQLSLDRLYEGK